MKQIDNGANGRVEEERWPKPDEEKEIGIKGLLFDYCCEMKVIFLRLKVENELVCVRERAISCCNTISRVRSEILGIFQPCSCPPVAQHLPHSAI